MNKMIIHCSPVKPDVEEIREFHRKNPLPAYRFLIDKHGNVMKNA